MVKFKGARIEGNNIILTSPISQEEFSKFCKDLYGGRIPVYKPVGMFMKHNGNASEARCERDYIDIKNYEFIKNLSEYIPVEPKHLPGAYTKQGSVIEFDCSIKERANFKAAAEVKGRHTVDIATISPFASNLDMNNIIQVFAQVKREDYATDIESLKKDWGSVGACAEALTIANGFLETEYLSTKFGCLMAPKRVKVNYSDFYYYGYDTMVNNHQEHPQVLFEDAKDLLYIENGRNRLRTPIIICYRGTGEMDSSKVMRTLFEEPVRDFIPFEHVRFNISTMVGINVGAFKPNTNIIPLTFFKKVNLDSLQKIIDYYGEVD